jgi:isopropylmalate/homocitrate/citramalate synthase
MQMKLKMSPEQVIEHAVKAVKRARQYTDSVIDAPGLCSPSRKVVSNIINLSFMGNSIHGGCI